MTAFSRLGGTIAGRIRQIRETLPPTVRLIAVTKQVSIAAMREAYEAGIRDFGESRIQEAETKQAQLHDLSDITWHLIGHLQTNKAQRALEQFQWIHSVDSLKLAQRLDRLAVGLSHKPQICLQVKFLPDPTKYGWTVEELITDLPQLDQCENLSIQGLMTIPPAGLSETELRALFEQARLLTQAIQQEQSCSRLALNELSMGMSGDYRTAVEAGATMVRLGRILFGDRAT
ncbi:YggS family pyridoxal phosphate-dependent enzyme [Leptolyngbya sp. FACHB-36]|uniref:YggS family pyridoxal phosphate-dependent enzyme n=1 Tax=Leptolyngbya sp. FACHB-36 TaxID=2692808 RepID=UPI001680A986|nr:YggS family pyridoxal phosphate-dependent enzyme [Leptolyngbya sp. FACHB-36]MBD2022343.1 YggS family pyridoxal phosphate-dependent enzyme [Leptolyngbya sp. FACHB-36]